ncbi:sigma-70 family RNA polymerase sigma factor [Fulvivirgaceae bacterium BMA10]|uniref:Sigma-70 family RNA polymerase sigma factor n=1 Tax=Splendidivirga corallicola TaxID=3051826 RepID=A0ABT8KP83_9BACT|nr:sigma-70 family RNA polymerase sigma factor [Fulvivirgaceae bacterium BMA10]
MEEVENDNVCEQSVFENLFRTLAPLLRNFLMYKFQHVGYAEDTVQEAFYTLWQNCKNVSQKLAKAYVYRVAQNQMIKRLEKDKVHRKYMSFQTKSENEVGPDFYMEYHELSEKLKVAIEQLPDGQREVFLMHRFDNKSYAEIADELEVSVKAIEKRMHKALLKLRVICKKL